VTTIQRYTQPNADPRSLWVPPPLLSGEEYAGKDFNLRSDCAYWLSIQSFLKNHRGLVGKATFTVEDRDATPYLTIEFKKSENTIEQATNQAIAASSLAFFNRFHLKENRLSASNKTWNRKHFDQIRHYTNDLYQTESYSPAPQQLKSFVCISQGLLWSGLEWLRGSFESVRTGRLLTRRKNTIGSWMMSLRGMF
jgi:hypothetical protein